jgi:hypothetical protein
MLFDLRVTLAPSRLSIQRDKASGISDFLKFALYMNTSTLGLFEGQSNATPG